MLNNVVIIAQAIMLVFLVAMMNLVVQQGVVSAQREQITLQKVVEIDRKINAHCVWLMAGIGIPSNDGIDLCEAEFDDEEVPQ